MDILSWQFAAFTALVLAVYYLLARKAQNAWLLLASYFFYLTWAWQFLAIILATTGVNFFLAWQIEKDAAARKARPAGKGGAGAALWLGLAWNVAALILFHLASSRFGPPLFGLVFHQDFDPTSLWMRFLFPVGFSFYTLQAISYLVDVSRRQVPASRNLVNFALYMAYFPKLTAGPIERARSFLPLLEKPRQVDNQAIRRSVAQISVGLVRKMVVAETLRQMIPADLFANPENYSAAHLWGGLLAYSFILYNDFAGYTSLMRGLSGLFGIELSQNFNQPYFSRSFTDYWTRWHISLSNWLRDYIYFPVSRALLRRLPNPRHPLNLIVPPMLTMLVSGLWHGLNLGMLTWSGLHGVYQAVERLAQGNRPRQAANQQPLFRQVAGGVLTFALVSLAWVPFATTSISNAIIYWQGMVLPQAGDEFSMPFGWIFGMVGLSLAIDWAQYHAADEVVFLKWVRPVQAVLLALAVLLLLASLGRALDVSGFVYQGF